MGFDTHVLPQPQPLPKKPGDGSKVSSAHVCFGYVQPSTCISEPVCSVIYKPMLMQGNRAPKKKKKSFTGQWKANCKEHLGECVFLREWWQREGELPECELKAARELSSRS